MATPTKLVINCRQESSGTYYKDGTINKAVQDVLHDWNTTFTFGTGSGQANRYLNPGTNYGTHNEIILAAAAQNYDFFGSLTDGLGNTANWTGWKSLLIVNLADPLLNPSYQLTVTGNLFNGLYSTFTSFVLDAGDYWHVISPVTAYTITDTSKERVTFDPGANSFHVFMAAVGVQ